MSDSPLTELTVDAILKEWPQTVEVFNHYSSSCIGCAIAPFCKIEDAVNYYGLLEDRFMHDLHQIIEYERVASDSN